MTLDPQEGRPSTAALPALRRFVRRKPATEVCELCSAPVPPGHRHLVDAAHRRIVCACEACAMLFSHREDGRFKRVPVDVRPLEGFVLSNADWDAFAIPIGLAFFFRNSATDAVSAFYPSPAGATESLLSLDAWNEMAAANPALEDLQPDVEALLVNRVPRPGHPDPSCFIVPIDLCYRLVGIIRMHWRGFGGGTEVWQQVDDYFAILRGERPRGGDSGDG